jgi:hypothetical protein
MWAPSLVCLHCSPATKLMSNHAKRPWFDFKFFRDVPWVIWPLFAIWSKWFWRSTRVNIFDLWARVGFRDLENFEWLLCAPHLVNCFGVFVGPFCNTSLNIFCRFTNILHLW